MFQTPAALAVNSMCSLSLAEKPRATRAAPSGGQSSRSRSPSLRWVKIRLTSITLPASASTAYQSAVSAGPHMP